MQENQTKTNDAKGTKTCVTKHNKQTALKVKKTETQYNKCNEIHLIHHDEVQLNKRNKTIFWDGP